MRKELTSWDLHVSALRKMRSQFRIYRMPDSPIIYIREYDGGKVVKTFSSKCFRHASEKDVIDAVELCKQAHIVGKWTHEPGSVIPDTDEDGLSWQQLADITRKNLRARIAREGSRKNAEGHLTELSQLRGAVTVEKLGRWANERDPIEQPSAFRNRIETISHIDKAGLPLDLQPLLRTLRAQRPTGAVKKEQDRRTLQVRCIPNDQQMEEWLDSLSGLNQWVLAMIATYGLRPSEAWHVVEIDDDGWATIPGEGATKTDTHFARPVPAHWVERYGLRENLEKYHQKLNARWTIKWEERGGLRIPTNNSVVSNALYQELETERIPRLYVGDEWLRPYDLRHSYAIRCEGAPELSGINSSEFAKWMGHTFEIHKRIYLKHMSPARRKEAVKMRGLKPSQERQQAAIDELPEEILAKLRKLEKLEKLLAAD